MGNFDGAEAMPKWERGPSGLTLWGCGHTVGCVLDAFRVKIINIDSCLQYLLL